VTQTLFTIITQVDPARVDDLKSILASIGADPATNAVLPLARFDGLHFASLVLAEGKALPPTLIFEHNVDGSLADWLKTLVANAAAGLDSLYAHCVGYPSGADTERVRAYLTEHVVRPGAYHIGATGRSLARIRQEAELHQAIEAHLDSEAAAERLPKDAVAVRTSVQRFVGGNPAFSWAKTGPPRETKKEHFVHLARLVAAVAAAIVLLPVALPVLVVWVVALRVKERTDPVQQGPADPSYVDAVSKTEDFVAQNHLASVIPVKPGMLRAVTLPTVLYVVNLVARVTATKGQLGGIPSIHFAHWSRINGGRHLLFLSNFDGSWESYLGDFIDKAALGLTAVWSNTVNFPRTRLLIFDGATDGPRFRQWGRANQCPTAAWYSAYPAFTMPIIDNNSSIREELFGSLKETEVQAWLRRL
jgi:hypothetical protein